MIWLASILATPLGSVMNYSRTALLTWHTSPLYCLHRLHYTGVDIWSAIIVCYMGLISYAFYTMFSVFLIYLGFISRSEPSASTVSGPLSLRYSVDPFARQSACSSYNCQHDGTAKMHCSDVIMSATASQITRPSIVCITVCSYQRRYQSSASLAFVMGIHRWPVYSPHKGPVTQKMFPFDDIIMMYQINSPSLQDSGHIVPSWKVL